MSESTTSPCTCLNFKKHGIEYEVTFQNDELSITAMDYATTSVWENQNAASNYTTKQNNTTQAEQIEYFARSGTAITKFTPEVKLRMIKDFVDGNLGKSCQVIFPTGIDLFDIKNGTINITIIYKPEYVEASEEKIILHYKELSTEEKKTLKMRFALDNINAKISSLQEENTLLKNEILELKNNFEKSILSLKEYFSKAKDGCDFCN